MIATLPFIQETFDHFNKLCFEGELPSVPIILSKARTFLGKMEYKGKRGLFGLVTSNYDFKIKISTIFDLSREELEDVVIHEMIHYYIAYRNIKDTSVHGEVFRRIMETINQKYGRHIEVRHRYKPEEIIARPTSPEFRKHYLCVSTFKDGTQGITVCASTKIFEIYKKIPRYYDITSMDWYGTIDPFFNRFPRSNTPKIYRINKEDLAEHLKDAIKLRCDGSVIEIFSNEKVRHHTF